MPYKSLSQERWAHTKAGTKALGKKTVEEFDKASKGIKLPKSKPKISKIKEAMMSGMKSEGKSQALF